MRIPNQCPMCGSTSWRCINTQHSNYSFEKSILFSLFLEKKIGKWFGFIGTNYKIYGCNNCGLLIEYKN